MENTKDKVIVNKKNKILKSQNIQNYEKKSKEKDENLQIKNSGLTYKYKRNNLNIKNNQDDIKKNIINKHGDSPLKNTIQNSSKNKNINISNKFVNMTNKKVQKQEKNIRFKINNFSDIKVKKVKSNYNSILINFSKDNPMFQNRLNIIKPNSIKNNKKTKANISYINKNKKKKASFKDIFGINNEYFKSFKRNKYSKSFVNEPIQLGEKFNLLNIIKRKNETFLSNKKRKNISNSFEDKKNVKKIMNNKFTFKNSSGKKINNKRYNSSLNSKNLIKLKNNKYQLTEYSSPSFNKIFLDNNNGKNMNSFERINSHKILITNININLYKEKENNFLINSDENRYNNLKFAKEIILEGKNIDLENVYLLELKTLKILKKINEYIACDEECLNWIDFYFGIKFYDKELNVFKKINNYEKINNYSKMEIICYYLCYDISLNQNFSKASILLKEIINILHQNFLILMKYLLYSDNNINNNNLNNNNNNLWVDKIEKLIENELKINLSLQDMNEDSITSLIYNSFKNILNYYIMIIENLYKLDEDEDIDKNEKRRIISMFFKQAYKSLNNYSFEKMKLFFYSTLNNQNKYYSIDKNQEKKFYLSTIKTNYKYTLIINLDETLIYSYKSRIILRPNLFEFLSKVKEMFEIIVYSFYSKSIIDKALGLIEKKIKYFDYILYSDQLTIKYNEKLLKDIDNLGRNIKHMIIIDSKINVQKKYKNNLILIKRFLGDITTDINILKILGYILQNIKNDNFQDDLRIRIHKYKSSIKAYLL